MERARGTRRAAGRARVTGPAGRHAPLPETDRARAAGRPPTARTRPAGHPRAARARRTAPPRAAFVPPAEPPRTAVPAAALAGPRGQLGVVTSVAALGPRRVATSAAPADQPPAARGGPPTDASGGQRIGAKTGPRRATGRRPAGGRPAGSRPAGSRPAGGRAPGPAGQARQAPAPSEGRGPRRKAAIHGAGAAIGAEIRTPHGQASPAAGARLGAAVHGLPAARAVHAPRRHAAGPRRGRPRATAAVIGPRGLPVVGAATGLRNARTAGVLGPGRTTHQTAVPGPARRSPTRSAPSNSIPRHGPS